MDRDTIYGLRTAVLTTDENLVKHKSLLYPFTVWLITETDQDSLTRQLWKYCSELLRSTPDRQHTSTTTFDLVLVYLKNRTNQVILHVANVVTGNLLSISPQVPFLGVLGFDPNWKKSFEELVSFKDCPVPFMPRQSFQSVDELILEKQW